MLEEKIQLEMESEYMNEFKNYHPIVNFTYFVFVIGFAIFFMHPICLLISLVCSFIYSVILIGKKRIKINLIYMVPMLILMALINPAFSHEGITILAYLPSGNPLTLESIIYGFCVALMIINVISWFSCYNKIMTSDKFIYLFGKIIPAMSLIISMTLRFVPKFSEQIKVVINVQRCMGKDISNGSLIKRIKVGISILSIMITWALENAVETADSMKSRGYGVPGRTAFSIFTFDKRDKKAIICIFILGIYVFVGNLLGGLYFRFYPSMEAVEASSFVVSVLVAYFLLCICPVIIEILEVRRWKVLKSKI